MAIGCSLSELQTALQEFSMPDDMYSVDWVAHHADRSPGSIACVDVHSNRELAYAEFDDRISRISNALRDRFKIPVGGRVLVLSRNDADVFGLQFACHRASATFVPLNWRLSSAELELIAKDATPSILFYGSEFRDVAEWHGLCSMHRCGHRNAIRCAR
jgi:fatty-acyl-CoA synthase